MDFSKLTAYVDTLWSFDIPSFDLSVHYKQKEVYRRSFGFADAQKQHPVTPQNMQWMYSMSKVITCTGVMRLIERGDLHLDDKVSDYLPEYGHLTVRKGDEIVPAQNALLIRHLFSMRAGMNYDLDSPSLKKARENRYATTRELVAAMAKEPLDFEPGTKYQYSLAHDVLAAVAEVVTGKTFYEFLNEELFLPLGMKDIGYQPTEAQKKRFTQQYFYNMSETAAKPGSMDCCYRLSDRYESGGAGLFCTVDEYMKLIDALAGGGTAANGYHVLNRETIDLMRTNQQAGTDGNGGFIKPGYGYGFGVRTMMDKKAGNSWGSLGEFGWDGAASSYCMIDPDLEISAMYAVHIMGFGASYNIIQPNIRNYIYEGLGLAKKPEE